MGAGFIPGLSVSIPGSRASGFARINRPPDWLAIHFGYLLIRRVEDSVEVAVCHKAHRLRRSYITLDRDGIQIATGVSPRLKIQDNTVNVRVSA